MTPEEKYAELLAESAQKTAQAMKSIGHKTIVSKPSKKDPCVFDLIYEGNKYNIITIINEFALLGNFKTKDLFGNSRKKPLANARHVLAYVLHDIVGVSSPQIARIFKRDPSTILSSIKAGRTILNENVFLMDHINSILLKARNK